MGCSQGHFIRLNEVLDQLRQSSALPQSEGCSFEGILHESKKKKKNVCLICPKKVFLWKHENLQGVGIWHMEFTVILEASHGHSKSAIDIYLCGFLSEGYFSLQP